MDADVKNLPVKRERNLGLDLLRMVSMFMVLLLHVLGQGGVLNSINRETSAAQFNVAWLIEISAYCAVNCYALISGYVGIKSKFKYSNIVTLWIQVVFYTSLITLAYSLTNPEVVNANHYWTAIFPVMKRAYWYFSSYFCIYFFIPVFNFVINNMPKKQLAAVMISIIAIFSVIYTLARSNVIGAAVDDLFVSSKGYSPLWLALLYLLGAYISKYRDDFRIRPLYCFICYLACILFTWLEKLTAAKSVLVGYTSPTILLCALALLLGFSEIKIGFKPVRFAISFLSPLSFGVYLIHTNPLVWNNFMKNRYTDFAEFPVWKLILAVFLAAVCLYLICSAIDLVRHLLFKLLHLKPMLEKAERKVFKNLWSDSASLQK
jgi:surface polysaccharide O-acyltransferase-like enzyme